MWLGQLVSVNLFSFFVGFCVTSAIHVLPALITCVQVCSPTK